MTGVVLGAMGLLGMLLNRQSHAMAGELARALLAQKTQQVQSRVENLIASAERQARVCRELTPAAGLKARDFLPTFERLLPGFMQQAEFSYLGYAVEATGEYAFLERRDATTCRLRAYLVLPSGERVLQQYSVVNARFVLERSAPWSGYDPRERPFYAKARASEGAAWTSTYLFRGNDWHPEWLGITHVMPVRDPQGNLLGVWDVDFDMSELSRFLKDEASDHTGYAFVMECAEGEDPVLIAHPDAVANPADAGMASPLDPVLKPFLARFLEEKRGDDRIFRVGDRDSGRLIAYRKLPPTAPSWVIAVVFDEATALARLESNRQWIWLLVLGVTAIAVLTAAWLAHVL